MSYEFRAFPGVRPSRRASGRVRPDMKLAEVIDHWSRARQPRPKTIHSVRTAITDFVGLLGDIPIGMIRHEEIFDYRDLVALLPVGRRPEEHAGSPLALVDRFEAGDDDRPRLAITTVGKKVNAIQCLLGYAYSERWIEEDDVHNIQLRKEPVIPRRPFTKAELKRLFALPLFISPWDRPERPHLVSNETIRWLFLLALMSGARIEELCQLEVADIVRADGIWQIAITDSDQYGPTAEKQLKSRSSRRSVPIHRRLIDLGVLRLVKRRIDASERRLFPELVRDQHGRLSSIASRRCNAIIDGISKDPALVFHSLRHFFKTLCRNARLEDSTNDQLTGHAPLTVGRRYGEGLEMPALWAEIEKLDFEFIDWEPVLRAVSP